MQSMTGYNRMDFLNDWKWFERDSAKRGNIVTIN